MDAQANVEERLRQATKLADAGCSDIASSQWMELRLCLPDNPEGYLLGADLLRSLRKFREAETLICCGISRFPQNYWGCRQLVEVARAQNHLGEAVLLLKDFIVRFPKAAILQVDLASIYLELGMADKAEILTEVAIREFPNEKGLHHMFANAAAIKGNTDVSFQRWNSIWDRWPDDALAPKRLIALRGGHQTTELRNVIDRALRAFPGEPEFHVAAIRGDERAHAWDQVCTRWRDFRKLFPTDPSADFGEAEALERLGSGSAADDLICAAFEAAVTAGAVDRLTCRRAAGEPRSAPALRTVLFCTVYADTPAAWNARYRRWLDAVQESRLEYSQILLVDDGSGSLPPWPDVSVFRSIDDYDPAVPVGIFRFDEHLGRSGMFNFPGWYRSFGLPAQLVRRFGVERLFHIESDAFIISDRLTLFFNGFTTGWAAMWPIRRGVPETGIQLIAGPELATYIEFVSVSYKDRVHQMIEKSVPITYLAKEFKGDRYGEDLNYVPWDADWTMQTPNNSSDRYLWWLAPFRSQLTARQLALRHPLCEPGRSHDGAL